MCFALGNASWQGHPVKKCQSIWRFTKQMDDPDQRPKLIERLSTKSSSAKGSEATDRTNAQSQQPRNRQSARLNQSNKQDPAVSSPQMQQVQHMQTPVFREYSHPFGQQPAYFTSSQPSGGPSEYVSPWH